MSLPSILNNDLFRREISDYITTDIYCISLLPMHSLFFLHIDLLSLGPISICVPFIENNRLACFV